MPDQRTREFVRGMYPGSKMWAARVDRMSDKQVFAIYMREINSSKKGNKK